MTALERRILSYLEQHGPTHRADVVAALASDKSRIARGISNGSNGAIPLIMGKWCSKLIAQGFVVSRRTRNGYYQDHAITESGRAAYRKLTHP